MAVTELSSSVLPATSFLAPRRGDLQSRRRGLALAGPRTPLGSDLSGTRTSKNVLK